MIGLDEFRNLHHAVTLLGMSGVGKTVLSTALRRSANWFHYSADYRIGTRYLAEDILDNVKFKIMRMRDPFVANLLRSDSIYISHNISVENLEPVSTFLGMYGDPAQGGLDKATFLDRQDLYRRAEVMSMIDAGGFISKAWQIYGCKDFINDASGSLCEIVDLDDADAPVIRALTADSLILYIQADAAYEDELKDRARTHPKPLFYNPTFITPRLADKPDDGAGIDPLDFARPLFPELLEFRKPRYQTIANNYGFTIYADDLFQADAHGDTVPDADTFLAKVHGIVSAQAARSETAAANLARYVEACGERARSRKQ
ncbi:MAG: hypothetical protein VW405_10165 [Rhodospirillaceae bacterium]